MSLTDKEVYTEAMIAAYRRLMDITFYDAAADMEEDEEDKPEKEKS
jgi:hypothetical protein